MSWTLRLRSLRWRLGAAMAAVLILALCAVALASGWATRIEARRHLDLDEPAAAALDRELEAAAASVRAIAGTGEDVGTLRSALEAWRQGAPERRHAMAAIRLTSEGADLVAFSDADLAEFQPKIGAHGLTLTSRDSGAVLELRVPHRRLDDAGLRLYPVPTPELAEREDGSRRSGEQRFLASVDRRLFAAVSLVTIVALLAMVSLGRRLLAPIERLTAVAGRFEAGERGLRVALPGEDEIARLGRAFDRMFAAFERTDELRRQLIADSAHELRTPLTNVRCQLEALQDGLLAPDGEALGSLLDDVLHLQALVADLQDLALLDSGQVPLELTAVRLAPLVEEAARAARRPDGAVIHCEVQSHLEAWADPRRLRQMLDNLLDNALRHTDSGRVEIASRALEDGFVEVSVRDAGEGIPEEHLDRVFERFHRVDGSRQRRTGGTGLGLAIVRQLTRLQGGDAVAEHALDGGRQRGTVIRIRLPAAPADDLLDSDP